MMLRSVLLIMVGAGTVAAQPMAEPQPMPPQQPAMMMQPMQPAPEIVRTASITFSPVHLILPVIEVTAEFHPGSHTGIAVIGGAGKVSSSNISATATEIGGQFNYYLFHQFTGLHLGVEAVYLHVSNVDVDVTASGAGLAIGPYGGWKYTSSAGFTFSGQLGVDFLTVSAKSSSSSTASEKKVSPLLNLNVGWSF